MLPIVMVFPPTGILSQLSTDAQMSLVDRSSRPGEISAWATERRATNGSKKRMLTTRTGREGKREQAKTELVSFYGRYAIPARQRTIAICRLR